MFNRVLVGFFSISTMFGPFTFSNILLVVVFFLFSCSEDVSHVLGAAVLMLFTFSPPGFFGGLSMAYSSLFALSWLIKMCWFISLPSWPFEVFSSSHILLPPLLLNLLLSFILSCSSALLRLLRWTASPPPVVERLMIPHHPMQHHCCHTPFPFKSCLIRSLVFRPC